jgi:hypothetical protein
MARIELRYCTITLSDGLGLPSVVGGDGATAEVATTAAVNGDTSLDVSSVYIPRAKNHQKIPVGARFTLASEANNPVHVVQSRVQATGVGTNEIQQIKLPGVVTGGTGPTGPTGSEADEPTGGTFTLSFGELTTIPIAYNASASAVQSALNSLIGLANCFVATYQPSELGPTGPSGPVGPAYWTVEFQGALGNAPQQLLVGNGLALTGSSSTAVTVTEIQVGTSPDQTASITFSPAIGAASSTYAVGDVITFQAQQLAIKIGEGNLTYTEKKEYKYDLERGNLDAVREGNEVPVDMKFEAVYEHITTGTGEPLSPIDALKGELGAAEWVTSDPVDPCQPYSVQVQIEYVPPCSSQDIEYTVFPDYRVETKEIDFQKAMISVNGKCNITEAEVYRVPQ